MKIIKEQHIKCPHCHKNVSQLLINHLIKKHNYDKKSAFICALDNGIIPSYLLRSKNIPIKILIEYVNYLWRDNNELPKKFYDSQFNSFYTSIVKFKEFENNDFEIFFNSILPWKLEHPGCWNSKELCNLTFPNNSELADKMYKETILIKNPYYQHDGSLSPFSKNFNGYKNLSNEEKEKRILAATKHDKKDRNWNQIEYWIKKGYSEKEAISIISEKQKTFTLEKCIKKYGEELGQKKWKERQEKWQNTLNSKPKEEIERISKAKMMNGRGYSKISQDLFNKLYLIIKSEYHEIFFATKDNLNSTNHFSEFMVFDNKNKKHYFLDFYVKDNNKIIEFDGDYWHGEKRGNQERDKIREENLKQLGFVNILHVKECNYKTNPDKVISECIEYLRGK